MQHAGTPARAATAMPRPPDLVRRWDLPPDPAVLTGLRAELRAAFTAWALTEDDADRALLVVNELVSNVVDHARTPCLLTVRSDGRRRTLHVRVKDGATALPQQRPHDPRAARGRGLQMVDAVCSRWGFMIEGDGKTVWAVVGLAEPGLTR
jgi:anti-sigma regulatory factor (Ser/Thr protein kinase)